MSVELQERRQAVKVEETHDTGFEGARISGPCHVQIRDGSCEQGTVIEVADERHNINMACDWQLGRSKMRRSWILPRYDHTGS